MSFLKSSGIFVQKDNNKTVKMIVYVSKSVFCKYLNKLQIFGNATYLIEKFTGPLIIQKIYGFFSL